MTKTVEELEKEIKQLESKVDKLETIIRLQKEVAELKDAMAVMSSLTGAEIEDNGSGTSSDYQWYPYPTIIYNISS